MAMTKRSVVLEEELVEQAVELAGPRGFSRLMNAALRRYLQAQGIRQLEEEFAAKYGPITEEEWAWAEEQTGLRR